MARAEDVIAQINYTGGMRFVGSANSKHEVVMDAMPDFGGEDSGARPMELLLIGLGGCTGMDAISVLKKKKQPVKDFQMNIRGVKSDSHPMRYTEVTIEFVVTGDGVDAMAVKRAVELSMQKYCSVKATLEENTKVDFTYRVDQG